MVLHKEGDKAIEAPPLPAATITSYRLVHVDRPRCASTFVVQPAFPTLKDPLASFSLNAITINQRVNKGGQTHLPRPPSARTPDKDNDKAGGSIFLNPMLTLEVHTTCI